MDNEKVYAMSFAKIYPLLKQKVERKGRTQAELDAIIQRAMRWLIYAKWRARAWPMAISSHKLLRSIPVGN